MGDNIEETMVVCPKGMKINKEEYVKVIMQALHSLGYGQTARFLERMSDFSYIYQPKKFENLRTQFVNGFWDKCAYTLCGIDGLDENTVREAAYLIFQQWLLESLALDRSMTISNVLRNDFTYCLEQCHIVRLATLIAKFHEMNPYGYIDGLNELSCVVELRKLMLKKLEALLPVEVAMFDNRLLALIESGYSAQINSCVSHNAESEISLYQDHSCGTDHLPTKTQQVLTGHTDAVWYVKFSHNGLLLASASRDHTAIIWEVPAGWRLSTRHVLRGHRAPVSCVSWSSNDEWLLTCACREVLIIWKVHTGERIRVISDSEPVLSSCALLSDQLDLIYGTPGYIHLVRNEGAELVLFSMIGEHLIVDFAITPNGSKLIIICPEGKIVVLHIHTEREDSIREGATVIAASVSEDSENLILNLSNHKIHVWDLTGTTARLSTYCGHKQSTGVTHSCFGGLENAFLVSGTEDSKVCIWNRKNENPLVVLSGHLSTVKCVSWNPERPQMLASASDDGTIRIWGPQDV